MAATPIQFHVSNANYFWPKFCRFCWHVAGWRSNAWQSFCARSRALWGKLRSIHTERTVVATTLLHLHSWWTVAHRVQHVVPLGSRQISGIHLRALDVCGGVFNFRFSGKLRQHFLESLHLERGASGAIFGIAGALIASFYLGEFSLPKAAMSGMLRSVMLFVGYNLFFGAIVARTDNAAHVGGLLMGLLMGALIAKLAPRPETVGLRLAIALVGLLLVLGGAMWLQRSAAASFHRQVGAILVPQSNRRESSL
jgi:Rhomboid family.